MNKMNFGINSLGIPQSATCESCGGMIRRSLYARQNLAECIMANGAGMWALENCPHCGYVMKTYPTAINGQKCTKEECDQLHEEMKKLENPKEQILPRQQTAK